MLKEALMTKKSAAAVALLAAMGVTSELALAQSVAPLPAPVTDRMAIQPTPRLPGGNVDLGGKGVWAPIWVLDWADKKYVEEKIDVPFTPDGLRLYNERQASQSKDDPEGYCLPAGVPRYTGTPYPFQIIQLPDRVVILYEGASHMYRVILLNAKHSADPNPSWLGESIGWYEGKDTLVVDTVGFNGRTWLDYAGHPASDRLHVVERFTRPNYGSLHYEATIEDPKNYAEPWTTRFNVKWRQGWEIQEYVCLENNKDLVHLGTKEPR
jgi:hypothetical protein